MIKDIKEELKNHSEQKYQNFSASLLPNVSNILGVRLPILRKIAARINKTNPKLFLKENDDEYYELTMIEGIVISKLNYNEQKNYIENFINKIDNWGICDSFCSSLKNFKKDYSKNFLEKYLNSNDEFKIRFGFVILLNYFIDDDYEYVIQQICKFNNDAYYAKIAVAWCLSICIIKNYNQAIEDIQSYKIHPWVLNKGITKSIESLRLTKEQKNHLKEIRKSK